MACFFEGNNIVFGTAAKSAYLGIHKTRVALAVTITGLVTGNEFGYYLEPVARCQNDPEGHAAIFCKVQGWIALLVSPVGVAVFLFGDLRIGIRMGSRWGEAALFFWSVLVCELTMIVLGDLCSQAYRSKVETTVLVLYASDLPPHEDARSAFLGNMRLRRILRLGRSG